MTSNEAPPVEPPTVFDYLSEEQVRRLLAPINPRRVSTRDGMSHLEAYDVRAHLDRIFGFANWDGEVIESWHLYEEIDGEKVWNPAKKGRGGSTYAGWDDNRKISCGYRVRYRLVIRSPRGRELARYTEEACGDATNFPGSKRADAHDFAVKTAESQALKRAATNLGDQFGLSLYHEGSRDAIVMRTLVGMPTEQKQDEGKAPDEHAPAVVPETAPEHPEASQALPGEESQVPSGPTDGETVERGPRESKPRRLKTWVDEIDAAREGRNLEALRQLYREAVAAAMFDADYEGVSIGDRIKGAVEKVQERAQRPSERAPVVEKAERDLQAAVEAKAARDAEREFQAGPGGDGAVPSEPAADADVKNGRVRNTVLAGLTEAYGNDEARDAAVEQLAGKPIGLVGNKALAKLLAEATGVPA